MKKYIPILISIIIISSAFFIYQNKNNKTLILVGTETPPFEYYDKNGNLIGIDIDFIEKIFSDMGINYKIQLMDWSEALRQMKKGKADMILEAGYTKERESYISYLDHNNEFILKNKIPPETLWIEKTSLFYKKNKNINASIDAIKENNYRLGIINGYSYFDSLWEANIDFYSFDSSQHLIEGLKNDEIDIALLDNLEGYSQIKLMGLDPSIFKASLAEDESVNLLLFSKKYNKGKYKKIRENFYKELINLKNQDFHETSYKTHTGVNFSTMYSQN